MSGPNAMIFKQAAAVASTANLNTYSFVAPTPPTNSESVSLPGQPGTITGSNAVLVIDGYTVKLHDRVLVKDQTDAKQNGIYTVTSIGDDGTGTGPIATLGSVTGGSGYANGTYTNVALSGGTGTGMKATVVVAGHAVTTVTVTAPGTGYTVADVLTTTAGVIGGAVSGVLGTGFSVPVATVVPSASVLVRAGDADKGSELEGAAVFVVNGTAAVGTAWVQPLAPIVLNTDNVTFKKFVG